MQIARAQWMLLAFWGVLGTSRLRVRLAGTALGLAIFSAGLTATLMGMTGTYNLNLFWLFCWDRGCYIGREMLVIAGALVILWLEGLRLVCFAGPVPKVGSIWLRFSIKQLLVLTLAVAAVLGAYSFARSSPDWLATAPRLVSRMLQPSISALLMCVVVTAALSPADPVVRLVLANFLVVLIALVPIHFMGKSAAELPLHVSTAAVQAIWLSATLLVVRACGYRLLWPADWHWADKFVDRSEPMPEE